MDNNKNRMKDRTKSKNELRKIDPIGNSEVGIKDGERIGSHEHNKKNYKTYEWMND